jgi:hypothetical protein
VFNYQPNGLIDSLGFGSTLNLTLNIRSDCYNNQSLITTAVNMGVLDASFVNLTAQASDQLDSVDFSALSNWNSG